MTIRDVSDRSLSQLISLAGRCAVITGGAQGLGKAIAYRMAEAGANVILGDLKADLVMQAASELDDTGAGRVIGARLDVTDSASILAVADLAEKEFGSLDIWVNNAGVFPNVPVFDTDDELFENVINVNLKGLFGCSREAARRMVAAGTHGVIVNVTSIAGIRGIAPGLSAYVASKHGVTGLTRQMALELAPHNIRVLGVAPTFTPTEGNREAIAASQKTDRPLDTIVQSIKNYKLGRPGAPDDIARIALFCASDMSIFMTGSTLLADGGNAA